MRAQVPHEGCQTKGWVRAEAGPGFLRLFVAYTGVLEGDGLPSAAFLHVRLWDERRQLALRRLPTNPCRQRITAETLGQPQLAPSLLFGIPRAGLAPSSARFA